MTNVSINMQAGNLLTMRNILGAASAHDAKSIRKMQKIFECINKGLTPYNTLDKDLEKELDVLDNERVGIVARNDLLQFIGKDGRLIETHDYSKYPAEDIARIRELEDEENKILERKVEAGHMEVVLEIDKEMLFFAKVMLNSTLTLLGTSKNKVMQGQSNIEAISSLLDVLGMEDEEEEGKE